MSRPDRDSEATVLVSFVSGLTMFAGSMGVPPDEALEVMQVDLSQLADPDAHISYEVPARLMRMLERRYPNEPIGLRLAERLPASGMGVVLYASRNCPTLRDALDLWVRYTHALSSHVVLERRGSLMEFSHLPELEAIWPVMDAALGLSLLQYRRLTGEQAPLEWVALRRPAPADPAAYAAWFGAEVRFDQPRCALQLKPELLDRPVVGADPELYRFISVHLEASERPRIVPTRSSVSELQDVIERAASDGDYSVEAVAAAAGVSARTLQRRAREAGTTLSELMDRHREAKALRLLTERRLSLDDVAFLLGYADERSFSRAFRRWTGRTPAAFRAASTAAGAAEAEAPSVH